MEGLREILVGTRNGLTDSIVFGISVITSFIRQQYSSKTPAPSAGPSAGAGSSSRQREAQLKNTQSANVLKRIKQCFFLSIFLISSMLTFEYALKGLFLMVTLVFGSQDNSSSTWAWLEPTLSYLFSAFWVLPLILLSRIVTTFWFQDIADTSFKGRPQPFRSISQLIADLLFSLLIQMLFLVQANIFYLVPFAYVGQCISLLHLSLLYALYSFEYKWFNMGWELHKRLLIVERDWPYYAGFGLPLALMTHFLPNYYINTALFALLFPLFILSANETNAKTTFKLTKEYFENIKGDAE